MHGSTDHMDDDDEEEDDDEDSVPKTSPQSCASMTANLIRPAAAAANLRSSNIPISFPTQLKSDSHEIITPHEIHWRREAVPSLSDS